MEAAFNIVRNQFDKIILVLIGWFFTLLFFVWVLTNIVRTNNYYLWFLTIPLSLVTSIFVVKNYEFNLDKTRKINWLAYSVLVFLLILVFFYYLEPVIRYPLSTVGIPNKDLHDGISVFIADHGYAPPDTAKFAENFYILSSQNGLYLGYPNLLHSFSALLLKAGIGPFQATWIAVSIGLFFASLAVFLLSRFIYRDDLFSALLGGFFAISSFRIPYAGVASIPMLFSLILLLPSLLFFLVSLESENRQRLNFILPSICISILAVSYGGTVLLFFGILLILLILLFLFKQKEKGLNLTRLILFSLPLLIFCLFFLKRIYWQNTFPTIKDFDPYELSQRLLPLDQPLYMIVLVISVITYLYETIKRKIINQQTKEEIYRVFFFVLVILFFAPIGFYFIFSSLNFQKMMRLALVQPFLFIFFLGYAIYLLKKPWRYILIAVILLFGLIIRPNLSFYQVVSPEVRESFYNQSDKNKSFTLLSHWRLILNDQIWSKDIFDGLTWLKNHQVKNKVLLWDERGWTEETVANWGSIYLRKKIIRPSELGIKNLQLDYYNLNLINNRGLVVFLIAPSEKSLDQYKSISGSINLFSQGQVFLYQLP